MHCGCEIIQNKIAINGIAVNLRFALECCNRDHELADWI
jgi:hypothetical protein